jgi:hypothetical protein
MKNHLLPDNVIEMLGLSALSPTEQEGVLEKFSGVLFQAVMLKSLEALNEEQKDKLEKVMEKNPEDLDKMLAFFRLEVPDFDQIVQDSIEEIRRAMVGVTGK